MSNRKDQSLSLPLSLHETYIANPLMATIKFARFKFAARMISARDDVLDLGCGRGHAAWFYANVTEGAVVGVDLYTDFTSLADFPRRDNLSFYNEDLLDPSETLLARRFDVVTCIDVIEHFRADEGRGIIERSSTLLRPGGMLVLGTPNRYSEAWRSAASRSVHEHEYIPEELRSIVDEYFARTLCFSMNDEVVHTGSEQMSWFFYIIAFKA